MPRRVLTLDLGVTTGWAFFAGRLEYGTITDHYKFLPELVRDLDPTEIIVEKPLIVGNGSLATKLQKIIALTDYAIQGRTWQVVEVRPGQWKPTPEGKAPVPKGITQHERDAIRIGLWYLRYGLQGE
jgi:hypothetical protein